ncbi:tRNA (adenosine(37)-N6)-dimethylallyltransferase MiaA [Suttonella sp. R2A3]|uniref:tRNA (adenosine(37)-N6)-dimethylallyltransferase MiaA n=1 Tax=Suttonella sp. R2A3 TaxID=2908648 RepID=UPI001F004AFD|nr:tRNA (adenosine(37)-N6)-dimethylallyltransferase MiaA [Suttonella sp. R2A3]UJF23914.1 tRNA (adenosine(37)-N6)-dimethylallyltransferase MiaA [Suttonella sp. R2A3]
MNAASQPVICLLGPTASGKTAAAFHLADQLPCRLISVDATQIYRGLDIGSAKPDQETLTRYPHALIDIINPEETYSAAQFCQDATTLIEQAHSESCIPVLVGGTMLYYHALFGGLADLPASDPAIRAQIEDEISEQGLQPFYEYLIANDPYAAEKLKAGDRQRIIRFTELTRLTGKLPHELFAEQAAQRPSWRVLAHGLLPERGLLHQRIAERFQQMIEQGFIEEVAELRSRATLSAEHPSMRSVGYRQIWAYLEGNSSREQAIEQGIIATRQLAKRQITWMRNRLREHLDLTLHDPMQTNYLAQLNTQTQQFLAR